MGMTHVGRNKGGDTSHKMAERKTSKIFKNPFTKVECPYIVPRQTKEK